MSKVLYPHDTSWTIERDGEEIDVLVEYSVDQYASEPSGMSGPPENYDPGSGWLFCILTDAVREDGLLVALTEAEVDKIHGWLAENHEEDDGYDEF